MLSPDRYFDPTPAVRDLARGLYERVARLPLVCPHGHVDPRILAEDTPFPDPAQLLVIPDHYVTRMLYSQGVRSSGWGCPRSMAHRSKPIRGRSGSSSPITSTCFAARRAAAG